MNLILLLALFFSVPRTFLQEGRNGWKTVQTFSGTGIETTDDFTISSSKWRMVWSAKAVYVEAGIFFSGFVTCNDCGATSKGFANVTSEGSGQSVFRTKGSHYIEVNSVNCQWKLEIQVPNK